MLCPTTQARIAHNRQTLCCPRPLDDSPQKPDLPASIATNGTIIQLLQMPMPMSNHTRPQQQYQQPHLILTPLPLPSSSSRPLKAKTTTPGYSSQHISLTPNGIKAGVAGGDAYNILRDHIGWWYDWSANPSKLREPIAVPMLWGSGHTDATDAQRLNQFQRLSSSSSNKRHPKYVIGYEEPDCTSGGGSSGIGVDKLP